MDDEFVIPSAGELSNDGPSSVPWAAQESAGDDMSAEDIEDIARGAISQLYNEDALEVGKRENFGQFYKLARGIRLLSSTWRKRLVDGLCSNLSVLSVSATAINTSERGDDQDTTLVSRNALKAYTFLLHLILCQGDQEFAEASKEADAQIVSTAAGAKSGRGKKKAVTHELLSWDWSEQQEKIMRALATLADVDFSRLFRPRPVDTRLVQILCQMALSVLASQSAMKSEATRDSAARILAAAALTYDQLEAVSSQLLVLVHAHEHLPSIAAYIAYSSARLGDNRLAVELIREVASVEPVEYERMHDSGGVRNVANFLVDLADRLPVVVAKNIALLVPHLGGKAYAMRSAIVSVIGSVIHSGFPEGPPEDADAPGTNARLRSKQHLLDLLLERARDQSAYTRARVLNTWSALSSSSSIPLGHWNCVTDLAIGRLEDKAALVRKAAIQMLMSLLHCNPFGPTLPEDRYSASVEEFKRKLQELEPARPDQEGPEEDPQWSSGEALPGPSGIKAEPSDEPLDEAARVTPTATLPDVEAADMDVDGEPRGCPPPSEGRPRSPQTSTTGMEGNVTHLRTLIASLEAGLAFSQAMSRSLPLVTQLLASSTLSDTQEAISLLIMCSKFGISGADSALRKMLPLVFCPEQGVKDAVVDAVEQLYLADQQPLDAARNLIGVCHSANLGELGALEEIVALLLARKPSPLLTPLMVKALWYVAERAHQQEPGAAAPDSPQTASEQLRGALTLLSMVASSRPQTVRDHLTLLLKVGLSSSQKDALTVRYACAALRHMGALPPDEALDLEQQAAAVDAVVRVVLRPPMLVEEVDQAWYSAAEVAVSALFSLHPAPHLLSCGLAHRLASSALSAPGGERVQAEAAQTEALSRAFFVVGHAALQQLVYSEALTKGIRRYRSDAEKAQAEARSDRLASGLTQVSQAHEEEDIGAQLGVGSVAADAELDSLKEAAEAEILDSHSVFGKLAQVVSTFCHNRTMLAAHPRLRSSSLLALTKLMAISPTFCDTNLQLFFTLLQSRGVEAAVRSNLVIAMGDLAFRFPNLLEPWTAYMYQPLSDPDNGVRKNAVMVLSHLILNDMMKVKGHIARLALCLQDPDVRIASLAQLFFHELSRRAYKGSNPIYNLLPDILSQLSAEPDLPSADFQAIMRHLLQYIGKEKHADSIVEKLCARFEATESPSHWRNLAFCLAQLSFTEKGLRKLMESIKTYRHALNDSEVLQTFQAIFTKGKKVGKQTADFKSDIEAFEALLAEIVTSTSDDSAAVPNEAQDLEGSTTPINGEPELRELHNTQERLSDGTQQEDGGASMEQTEIASDADQHILASEADGIRDDRSVQNAQVQGGTEGEDADQARSLTSSAEKQKRTSSSHARREDQGLLAAESGCSLIPEPKISTTADGAGTHEPNTIEALAGGLQGIVKLEDAMDDLALS